jgi:hypothetical protein
MLIRAQPFVELAYHGAPRQDYIAWRTPYSNVPDDVFDPALPAHLSVMGYGRAILFFKARIHTPGTDQPEVHDLAFIEELWRYSPPKTQPDQLDSQYGCTLLYSTSPSSSYYVIATSSILGPAAITRNPSHPRIPVGGLHGAACKAANPHARADRTRDDESGSPLHRLNIWHMMWGSMIAVQPLTYPTVAPLTSAQVEANKKRSQQVPGCLFLAPGQSYLPTPSNSP